MRISIRAYLAAVALLVGPALASAERPDFSGNWERNEKLSQDPFEKIELALGTDQLQGAGTRDYNAASRGTLLKDTDRVALRRSLLELASVLREVEIEQNEDEIKVWTGDDFFSLYYLDGEAHNRENPEGGRLEATASWDGDAIRVEQTGEAGSVLTEVYALQKDGKRLAILFHLESKVTSHPVLFRTVYDRVKGP